jgi:signal transduction histidine kinase
MSPVELLVALALDATAVVLLGWVTWTSYRARERPSAWPFIALTAALTLWALLALGSELPDTWWWTISSDIFDLGMIASVVAIPGIWTVYALSYTGRGTGLTRGRIAMLAGLALPVVASGIVFAFGIVLPSDPSTSAAERILASLIGTELMYMAVLVMFSTFILINHGWSHARVSKLQIAVLIIGVGAPYIAGVAGNNGLAIDGITVGLLTSGALLAVAVRRYPVMTGFPKADHVARTRVVEALQEAVVVLDWERHILDANTTTAELFDPDSEGLIGKPVQSVLGGLEQCDLSAGATGTVPLQTTKGRRQFQFSVSAVEDTPGNGEDERAPVARAVVLRDVTDQRTREQRLTVLNRVLRHNVRNKLDVVLAHADLVDEDEHRAAIRESVTDLLTLSKKARDAEEIMTDSIESPVPVDLTEVAATVAKECRTAHPEGEISLTCPDELVISTHRSVVQQVLAELVDNAFTHTDEPTPRIELSVRETDEGAAELAVADNGPGIPEREREILADETETPLEHGSGIGLWFVNWAVLQLGGDLEFGKSDADGSVVTVRLYGAESELPTSKESGSGVNFLSGN